MEDWSASLSFKEFSDFCEKIVSNPNKKSRYRLLTKFLASCRSKIPPSSDQTLYPIIRMLLPLLDKARGSYRIKETVLATLYTDFLQLGQNSADALKLKNFRAPKNNPGEAGDFASVLFTVMKQRSYNSTNISCSFINNKLDEIVTVNESEGRKAVANLLKELFLKMDATQQKWLVRLILKDMRLSLGQNSILNAVHPDAKEFFEVNADLEKLCSRLKDPSLRLHEMMVELMSPFKPQLADRVTIGKIVKEMGEKEFFIETKYDGERCQLHKKGDNFKYFSRNGFDFTSDYGDTATETGKFTSFFTPCLKSHVKDIILDGEICAWSKEDMTLLQKGEQFNIRQLKESEEIKVQQCLVLYDICLLNGKLLTNLPLRERIEILKSTVNVKEGRVELSKRLTANTTKDVVDALNDAIDRREEGLVIKDPDSVYKPGARAGGGWIKVKPEYQNQLMDQLDLVVIGGYYGKGRGGGRVSHFLLGVADRTSGKETFLSLCRVGSGYSASELSDLMMKCKPGKVDCVKIGKEVPEVWFDPRNSPVLQVKAAEIVYSDQYATGCTLRFPRVEMMRPDKDSTTCTTLEEVKKLQAGDGKLFGAVHLTDSQGESIGQGRKRPRPADKPGLGVIYRQQDLVMERVDTHCLKGKVVVVEPGNVQMKTKLEKLVVKHGGKVEQNVRPGHTTHYIETGMTIKARNVVNQQVVDVIKSAWLLEEDETGQVKRPRPHHLVWSTSETASYWSERCDQFEDPFTMVATRDSLKHSMEKVEQLSMNVNVSEREKAEFEEEAGMSDIKTNLFRNIVFYFPKRDDCKERKWESLSEIQAKFFGGSIETELSEAVTHVVINSVDEDNLEHDGGSTRLECLQELKQTRKGRLRQGEKLFHIVNEKWVEECVETNKVLAEEGFLL